MKAKSNKENTRLAGKALRRAAKKILGRAVQNNEPVPLWDGNKVVWKVPISEFEEMNSTEEVASTDS